MSCFKSVLIEFYFLFLGNVLGSVQLCFHGAFLLQRFWSLHLNPCYFFRIFKGLVCLGVRAGLLKCTGFGLALSGGSRNGFCQLLVSLLLHFGNTAPFVLILGFTSAKSLLILTESSKSNDITKHQVSSEPVMLKDLDMAKKSKWDVNFQCSTITERSCAQGNFTDPGDSV